MARHSSSSVASGLKSSYLSAMTGLGSSLLLAPLAFRTLGVTDYGRWLVLWQATVLLGAIDLGLGYAMVREVATVADRPDRLARILGAGRTITRFQQVVYATLGAAFLLMSHWHPIALISTRHGHSALALLVTAGVVLLAARYHMGVNLGLGELRAPHIVGVYQGVSGLISSLALLWLLQSILALALGALAAATTALLGQLLVRRRVAIVKPAPSERRDRRSLLQKAIGVWMAGLGWTVVASSDQLMVGRFAGIQAAGQLGVVYRLPLQASQLLSYLADSFLPRLSRQSEDVELFRATTVDLTRLATTASLIVATAVFGFLPGCVAALFGPEYAPNWPISVLVGLVVFLFGCNHAYSRVLHAAGHVAFLARVAVAEALINILVSVPLILYWGYSGAFAGTAVGALMATNLRIRRIRHKDLAIGSVYSTLDTALYLGMGAAFGCGSIALGAWAGLHSVGALLAVGLAWLAAALSVTSLVDGVFTRRGLREAIAKMKVA